MQRRVGIGSRNQQRLDLILNSLRQTVADGRQFALRAPSLAERYGLE